VGQETLKYLNTIAKLSDTTQTTEKGGGGSTGEGNWKFEGKSTSVPFLREDKMSGLESGKKPEEQNI